MNQQMIEVDKWKIGSTREWTVVITIWISLIVCIWLFARNIEYLITYIVLIFLIILYFLRTSDVNLDDFTSLPVWSVFVIGVAFFLIILSLLEKMGETRNQKEGGKEGGEEGGEEDRPADDSFASMMAYRWRMIQRTKLFGFVLVLWICIMIWLMIWVQQMPSSALQKFFLENGRGVSLFGMPGWMFMVGVWWLCFMFINAFPNIQWNRSQTLLFLVLGMGFFGVWSAKMIPGGVISVSSSSVSSVFIQVLTMLILLFLFIWFSYSGFFKVNAPTFLFPPRSSSSP
jgi:hypothetical protein